MDDPANWDKDKLENLIQDEITESLTLDYKAAAALRAKSDRIKKEISKDVSAFANSAGGVIVYGMIEENHLPVAIDGIDPSEVTREWLDQVISSRVQQRIEGIRINQVLLDDQNVVYIVVIPPSDRAPHMASDHRFYKRFEFHSVPMEEYEVRDVANRAGGPHLIIKMWLDAKTLSFNENEEQSQPIEIRANIGNENVEPANHAVIRLLADSRLQGEPTGFTNKQELTLSIGEIPLSPFHLWQLNWGVPGKLPIWNGMPFNLFDSSYKVRVPRGAGTYAIGWTAKAPRMAATGKLFLLVVDDRGTTSLVETTNEFTI